MENGLTETMTIEEACVASKNFSEAHEGIPDVIEYDEFNMEHLGDMKDIEQEILNESKRLVPNEEYTKALETQRKKIKALCDAPQIGSAGESYSIFQEVQD